MKNSTNYERAYEKALGEREPNPPTYPPEREYEPLTPEESVSLSMEQCARGLRLMQRAHVMQQTVETEVA